MSVKYFKTYELAQIHLTGFIGTRYPNVFQDARSVATLKIVEFRRGFAVQRGDYGPYLTPSDFTASQPPVERGEDAE